MMATLRVTVEARSRAVKTVMCYATLGLCCAVLCCAVLCCAVLCCAVLCCAVLCWAGLCCAVLRCAVLLVMICYAFVHMSAFQMTDIVATFQQSKTPCSRTLTVSATISVQVQSYLA